MPALGLLLDCSGGIFVYGLQENTQRTQSLYIAGRLHRVFLATKSMKLHERPCALCASLAPLALKVLTTEHSEHTEREVASCELRVVSCEL